MKPIKKNIIEAVIIIALAGTIALVVNMFHPLAIPLIARTPYETMVPCPVQKGDVKKAGAKDLEQIHNAFVIDARYEDEYEQWHYKDAFLLTYDFLDPIPKDKLDALVKIIANKRVSKVFVYGDGDNPDTGKLLAQDVANGGIKNVFYISGGYKSLQKAGQVKP